MPCFHYSQRARRTTSLGTVAQATHCLLPRWTPSSADNVWGRWPAPEERVGGGSQVLDGPRTCASRTRGEAGLAPLRPPSPSYVGDSPQTLPAEDGVQRGERYDQKERSASNAAAGRYVWDVTTILRDEVTWRGPQPVFVTSGPCAPRRQTADDRVPESAAADDLRRSRTPARARRPDPPETR